MNRPFSDPDLKRTAGVVILVTNSFLALIMREHGGTIEGVLYDSRVLIANGVSPEVAMKMQTAWSTLVTWTLQHPATRVLYSALLAYGLFGASVLLHLPWLLTSFVESCSQLLLLLACCWIILFHFQSLTIPLVMSGMIQLVLMNIYSSIWTVVALWTFQRAIEGMVQAIAAAHGPVMFMSFNLDPGSRIRALVRRDGDASRTAGRQPQPQGNVQDPTTRGSLGRLMERRSDSESSIDSEESAADDASRQSDQAGETAGNASTRHSEQGGETAETSSGGETAVL